MDVQTDFLTVAENLEDAGLLWLPEIGDEVTPRDTREFVSILVDPAGMPIKDLRATYLWLPNVDQIVRQFEARSSILLHAGLEVDESVIRYKSIIQAKDGNIEAEGNSLRICLGMALHTLLMMQKREIPVH